MGKSELTFGQYALIQLYWLFTAESSVPLLPQLLNIEHTTRGRTGTVLWKVLSGLDSMAPGPGQG